MADIGMLFGMGRVALSKDSVELSLPPMLLRERSSRLGIEVEVEVEVEVEADTDGDASSSDMNGIKNAFPMFACSIAWMKVMQRC